MVDPDLNTSHRRPERRFGMSPSYAARKSNRSRAALRQAEREKRQLSIARADFSTNAMTEAALMEQLLDLTRSLEKMMSELATLSGARSPNRPFVSTPLSRTDSGANSGQQFGSNVTFEGTAFFAGPRARAILRGKEIAATDLRESGGSYTLEEVRRLQNGVSRQSIEKRVREGRLLAVTGPNNKRVYPVAQFHDNGAAVEGLRAVKDALGTENGYAILNFLVNPDFRLDNRKPIDLLKKGELD